MKKIISSILLCVMSFNTLAAPMVATQLSKPNYIVMESNDNILVDKSNIETIGVDKKTTEKTFLNTKNIKISPVDEEEKRRAAVSNDPQNDKSHLDRFHEQRNTEQDRNIDPAQFGLGKAGAYISGEAENYLNSFGGTSRVTITGGSGSQTGSADVLIPINKYYDADKHLFFVQMGARKSNYLTTSYRTTLNLGAGYRYFTENNWMYGVNSFYDQDTTRGHQRIGFGAEAWTDNFKLSANTYHRLSDWKDSPDLLNYQERPANGFDVRAEGALPNLPQVTGKVMYEKYFGDEVGLFGENNRQKDPSALTVGLAYKPIPMLSIGLDHRMGQNSKKDTRLNIALNYQIGVPLSEQMKSSNVSATNSLKLNKTALVERNNEIVLEYKLKPTGSIKLPDLLNGNPLAVVTFPVAVSSNVTLTNFTWSGTGSGFVTPYANDGIGTITLPVYSTSILNNYTLQLSATDPTGRTIQSNVLNITVDPLALTLIVSKDSAVADGNDAIVFTATLKDKNDNILANKPVVWDVRNATLVSSDTLTDSNGQATATITSTQAVTAEVDISENESGNKITREVEFFADSSTAVVTTLVADNLTVPADGSIVSTLSATVRDANGNNVGPDVPVTWTLTGQGTLDFITSNTDSNGVATNVLISDGPVGSAVILAQAMTPDPGKSVTIQITADLNTAQVITVTPSVTTIPVSPTATVTFTALVQDNYGNPVGAGVPITWTTTQGVLSSSTSNTNSSSQAVITLNPGLIAGDVTVGAIANYGEEKTSTIQLTANPLSAKVDSITSESNSATANNELVQFDVKVSDAGGNPVSGATVNWSTTLGSLTNATSITDSNGDAFIILNVGTVTGNALVTARASAGDTGRSFNLPILPDSDTATPSAITASQTSIVAGSGNQITLTTVVRDANNNVISGHLVEWSALLGSLSGASSITDSNGVATIIYTPSNTAGIETITAVAENSSSAGVTRTINVLPNSATARIRTLTTNNSVLVANGISQTTLSATVEDANSNLVGSGVTVNWTTSLGSIIGTSTTNASGIATANLTSATTAGIATVTAIGVSGDTGRTVDVTFIADIATVRVDTLSASSYSVVAGQVAPITLTANIRDGNGNRLANVTTNWQSVVGLAGTTSVSDTTGAATMQWTPPTGVATYQINSFVNSNIVRTLNIAVTPNIADAGVTNIAPTQSSLVANGTSTTTINATVRDNFGNIVGAGVVVNWTSTTGSLSSATSITNSSGIASVTLTSPTTVGAATVAASSTNGVASSTAITFVADVATATVNNLTRDVNSVVANANGTSQANLIATVQDANGNAISGATVTWTTTLGSLGSLTSVTNASGVAVNTYNGGSVVGQTVITAKASAGDSGETTNINIIADLSSARIMNFGTNVGQVAAGTTDKIMLTAFAVDAYGNSINQGFPVTWTTTGGTLDFTNNNATGIGTARNYLLPPTNTGIVTLTARVSNTGDAGETITINFIANEETATVSNVTTNTTSVIANGVSEAILDATLVDANGNTFGSGFPVTWSTTGGSLNVTSSSTNSSGVAQARITSNTTGTVTVTARSALDSTGRTITINFTSDVSTARVTTLTPTSIQRVAGDSGTMLAATVRDINNNLVGAGVTVNWTTTIGNLAATSVTNSSGVATNVLAGNTAGTGAISATGPSGLTVTAPVEVSANTTTAMPAFNASSVTLPMYASTTSVPVTVQVTDSYGNPVGGGVQVAFTSSSGTSSFVQSPVLTNASGIATASFIAGTATGYTVITASSNGGAANLGFNVAANASTARVISLTPSVLNTQANGGTTLFSATLVDAYNNPLGANIPVTWTTSAGTLSSTSSMTNSSGIAQITLTSPTVATTGSLTARGVSGTPPVASSLTFTSASESRYDVNNRMEYYACASSYYVLIRWDGVTVANIPATAGVTSYNVGAYNYSSSAPLNPQTAAGSCGGNSVMYVRLTGITRTPN